MFNMISHANAMKCKSKSQRESTSHLLGWPEYKRQKIPSVEEREKEMEHSCSAGGDIKWCRDWKTVWKFFSIKQNYNMTQQFRSRDVEARE